MGNEISDKFYQDYEATKIIFLRHSEIFAHTLHIVPNPSEPSYASEVFRDFLIAAQEMSQRELTKTTENPVYLSGKSGATAFYEDAEKSVALLSNKWRWKRPLSSRKDMRIWDKAQRERLAYRTAEGEALHVDSRLYFLCRNIMDAFHNRLASALVNEKASATDAYTYDRAFADTVRGVIDHGRKYGVVLKT